MDRPIGDYGIIGNFNTVALVGRNGSIDWLCLPHIDSPSVFGALLDEGGGGFFRVSPDGECESTSRYLPGTNILKATFTAQTGVMRLTDFMPVTEYIEAHCEHEHHELFRRIEIVSGEVPVKAVFQPRFDYARAVTVLEQRGAAVSARSGSETLVLCSSRPGLEARGDEAVGAWKLEEGDRLWLHLRYVLEDPRQVDSVAAEEALEATTSYWSQWLDRSETGLDIDLGPLRPMVERSALVLKLLEFTPTGAITAAATTSLPEAIGGVRNWDYRFTWVRDSSMTIDALYRVGHLTEMENYIRWLKRTIYEGGAALQIMYGLKGQADLHEEELPHLTGYRGSRPVRVGNDAYRQKQLDTYGEIMDAALRLSNYVGKIDFGMWPFLENICEQVIGEWREPDSGIWEVRGGPYHFVYSKVMCWVALDRGITIAQRYGFPGDLAKWAQVKEQIRVEVLERGWHEGKGAFVQHYDTDALDASNLLIPYYGFIPYSDPRVVSNAAAVQRELAEGGFVYRYRTADGLPGDEGTFLVCTFWLIDNLIGQGRLDEAEAMLHRMESTANHLGLFSEEYDAANGEALGNFPQALTHIGYINSAISLMKARVGRRVRPRVRPARLIERKVLLNRTFTLNSGSPEAGIDEAEVASELKRLMNTLRGAFFRTAEGRIAYEEMAGSAVYERYRELSSSLQELDLGLFSTREERLAFWINLYNVLVIHGVIELGIRDSVKEIPMFFRRIRYRVGCWTFSADDIEHGILRGNRRLPSLWSRPFGKNDPRLRHIVGEPDPRIHFALVCASASCPPIEIYKAETLDEDLDISGRTFLNAGGVRIDVDRNTAYLSQVFRWYADDFGKDQAERIRFIAPYLFREDDRRFLEEHAEHVRVRYQPYDWRLNRT